MRSLAHRIFQWSQAPGWLRFRRRLSRPKQAQWEVLEKILQDNAGSEWGRRLGFNSVRSPEEFRERIPLCGYGELEPAIQRMLDGEKDVLFKGEASLFEPSGGSTSGPRLIPYNSALRAQFQAGLAPWIFDLYSRYPELKGGSSYWSITPSGKRLDRRIGFESDMSYFGGLAERLAGQMLAVPPSVGRLEDMGEFQKQTLDHLAKSRNLRFISIWNPSYLTLLLQSLPEPAKQWPELRLISCWADAHAQASLPALRALFPGVEIQPKGLLATEAMVSLPFQGHFPLSLLSHFFEFLDAEGRSHFAWELEEGREYSVVVTTAGGLYRYRMHDRVQVTGHLESTPCLRFLGKEDCVSDLKGEKLEEAFVARALERLFAGTSQSFCLLAPSEDGTRYVLYIELKEESNLEEILDRELRRNFHYDHCRKLGQLGPAEFCRLSSGSGTAYLRARAAEGRRLGSVKPLSLSPEPVKKYFLGRELSAKG